MNDRLEYRRSLGLPKAEEIEDWEQAATVEARLRHELQAENERLRAALIIAAQWMPTPGSEYTEDAKADVRQVYEALGWMTHKYEKRAARARG